MIKNTVVFLTGAAGCLGSATVKRLVSEGCKVCMFDLPNSKGKELEDLLGVENTIFCPGDVNSENDVSKALDETKNKFGSIKTVINCAAVHRAGEVYSHNKRKPMEMDRLETMLKVNLMGTMNVIRLAIPHIHENPVDQTDLRGLIINTSGFAAFDGQRGQTCLAGVWAGIEGMTMPLCRELGNHGIRVMTISPGLMSSNLTSFMPKKILDGLASLTPSPKRLGRKEEFAEMVVAIMNNTFLNGEVIRLNGGLRLGL